MRIVSKAEFAREAGVTPSAISKILNTVLRECHTEGGIDADHPAAIRYLSRSGYIGRPHGGESVDIADFVISRFTELRAISDLVPESVWPLVENLEMNLFYIGFAEKWAVRKDIHERMVFVDRSLHELNSMCFSETPDPEGPNV